MVSHKQTKEERGKYKRMMGGLKDLALETRIPIIVTHQLNRDAMNYDVPLKEHLAEGADIERLAYNVWIVFYRRVKDEGTGEEKTFNFVNLAKLKLFASNTVIPIHYNFATNTMEYPPDIPFHFHTAVYSKFWLDENVILNERARDIVIKNPPMKQARLPYKED